MLNDIEILLGEKIISSSALGGGCIANSSVIKSELGNKYFLKSYNSDNSILFNEANGLKELTKANAIRIPKVILVTEQYLVLEFISSGQRKQNFSELFGQQFAQMHRMTSDQFGFYENNFIGSNQQINLPLQNNWIDFFWENRLLFQFKLAEKNGYVNSDFRTNFDRLGKRLTKILAGTEEQPALLHGDLWGGNYKVDENGNPVLIDPAVYYGHREADIAMTKLFGGFDSKFYEAYIEEYPLPEDWKYRIDLYMLYHVLNHLNIFGSSYLNQAVSLIGKYTK